MSYCLAVAITDSMRSISARLSWCRPERGQGPASAHSRPFEFACAPVRMTKSHRPHRGVVLSAAKELLLLIGVLLSPSFLTHRRKSTGSSRRFSSIQGSRAPVCFVIFPQGSRRFAREPWKLVYPHAQNSMV